MSLKKVKNINIDENFARVAMKYKTYHLQLYETKMNQIKISENWDLNMNSVIETFDEVILGIRIQHLEERKIQFLVFFL